jgi:hypothetical protein
MNPKQRGAFEHELDLARGHIAGGRPDHAVPHLERAHVIGQREVGPHVQVHWIMFRMALEARDVGAAVGQAVRIVLGALGSAVGVVPTGNTGGTNISMFKRLPIDPELERIMKDES